MSIILIGLASSGSMSNNITKSLTILTNVRHLYIDYIDLGFSWVENDWSWRGPLFMQPVFAVILLIGTCFLPETPRWLMKRGQNDKALAVLSIM